MCVSPVGTRRTLVEARILQQWAGFSKKDSFSCGFVTKRRRREEAFLSTFLPILRTVFKIFARPFFPSLSEASVCVMNTTLLHHRLLFIVCLALYLVHMDRPHFQVHDKSNRIWSTIKVFQSLVCPLLSRIKVEGVLESLLIILCLLYKMDITRHNIPNTWVRGCQCSETWLVLAWQQVSKYGRNEIRKSLLWTHPVMNKLWKFATQSDFLILVMDSKRLFRTVRLSSFPSSHEYSYSPLPLRRQYSTRKGLRRFNKCLFNLFCSAIMANKGSA